jgi:hypothetical protein
MSKVKNYVGQRLGPLTVLERLIRPGARERLGDVDVIVVPRKWFLRSIFAVAVQDLVAVVVRSMGSAR